MNWKSDSWLWVDSFVLFKYLIFLILKLILVFDYWIKFLLFIDFEFIRNVLSQIRIVIGNLAVDESKWNEWLMNWSSSDGDERAVDIILLHRAVAITYSIYS